MAQATSPSLPAELWLYIFYLATYSGIRETFTGPTVNVKPYAYLDDSESDSRRKEVLSTKVAVTLVCSLWRSLSLQFLFEDIHIRIRGAHTLEIALEREREPQGPKLSSFVRCVRVQMYRRDSHPHSQVGNLVDTHTGCILALCQETRLLVTLPCAILPEEYSICKTVPFATVYNLSLPKLVYAQLRATSIIPDFVLQAPHLQYLSIDGHRTRATKELHSELRIFCANDPPLLRVIELGLSKLEKLIIRDFPGFVTRSCRWSPDIGLPKFTTSVRCLELGITGTDWGKLSRGMFFHFLSFFPSLESLYYPILSLGICSDDHVFAASTYDPLTPSLSTIRTIGLLFEARNTPAEDEESVVRHVEWLCNQNTPYTGLREIELCGFSWRDLSQKPCFGRMKSAAEESGTCMACEHDLA